MDGSVGFHNTREMDRHLSDSTQLSPKGRRIVVVIERDAKHPGIYLALFTNPEGDVVLVFSKSVG